MHQVSTFKGMKHHVLASLYLPEVVALGSRFKRCSKFYSAKDRFSSFVKFRKTGLSKPTTELSLDHIDHYGYRIIHWIF